MSKHSLHKHPPFDKKKNTYKDRDGFWIDRLDDIEFAYHPFDVPVNGWWSNKWIPEERNYDKKDIN